MGRPTLNNKHLKVELNSSLPLLPSRRPAYCLLTFSDTSAPCLSVCNWVTKSCPLELWHVSLPMGTDEKVGTEISICRRGRGWWSGEVKIGPPAVSSRAMLRIEAFLLQVWRSWHPHWKGCRSKFNRPMLAISLATPSGRFSWASP